MGAAPIPDAFVSAEQDGIYKKDINLNDVMTTEFYNKQSSSFKPPTGPGKVEIS